MNHRRKPTARRRVMLLNLALTFSLLAPGARAQSSAAPAPGATPAALIKNIVVNGQERTEATRDQALVTRGSSGEEVAASAGLMLYRGDLVETFGGTKLTLLFLDAPVAERGDEVIVDADARVGISSTDSWWGRIWVKLNGAIKGAFNSKTTYVRLAPEGTEYEFNVFKGEERATLVVLEGAVKFEKGTFPLAGQITSLAPDAGRPTARLPFPLSASFAHAISRQQQFGRAVDAPAGQITRLDGTYHVLNDCRQTHHFEFHTSDISSWLQLVAPTRVGVPAGQNLPFEVPVTIDARQLSPGQYRGRVYATCVDCNLEPACTQHQLEWPLSVTVTPGRTPPPTPTPTPTVTPTPPPPTQVNQVRELEDVTLTKGPDQPTRAAQARVLSVLNWTNNVILTTQPSYSAQNIIPHFATVEERSQSFRDARQRAILGRNEPGSNRTLGNVYSDWGQGAQAVAVYEKESRAARPRSATFEVDRAEAYRQTGRLDEADRRLRAVLDSAPNLAVALNAAGNLSLDRARVALDKKDNIRADDLLRQAQQAYQSAAQGAQAPAGSQSDPVTSTLTIRTNLGETYVAAGNLEQSLGRKQNARAQYQAAVDALEPVQQPGSQYPFAVTDLGRAYQGLGDVAKLEGKQAEANSAYAAARQQHERAIAAHRDFAEAYLNLGDLYDDLGDKRAAKENYWRAIKARPEQPAPYYPLALLVQKDDPRLAAALAAVYLQLEPEAFKQGERARNAELIRESQTVVLPKRPGELDTSQTPPLTPTPPPGARVPPLTNMTRAEAVSALQGAGFTLGRVDKRTDSRAARDLVVAQNPPAGTNAPRGSAVDLVVTGGKPVEVPDVIDDKEQTAVRKITQKGFTVGQITRRADCKSVGEVLEQNPPKHARVEPGTPVDLVIGSYGDNPVTVPDFRQTRDRGEAEASIRDLGFTLKRVSTEHTNQFAEGTVIRQSPKAGTQYAQGCKVNVELTVAVPIIYVDVQRYVGLSLAEARRRLSADQLQDSVTYQESSDYGPGTVIAQYPPEGTRVEQGTRVSLTVASERKVAVQNVVGRQLGEAREMLEGLNVVVSYQEFNPCVPGAGTHNKVLSQNIPAGRRVPAGTSIALVVAKAMDVICER